MGSITYINRNPKLWTAYDSGKKLKSEFGGENLINVKYGQWDDYPMGTVPMEILMRKSVYDKVVNKQFIVSPYHNQELVLLDIVSGKEVPKLNDSIY